MSSKMFKKAVAGSVCVSFAMIALLVVTGCAPTYPREKLAEAVKEVCRAEYGMNVDVAVEGSTLGIYYPMEGLLDINLGISTEAWDHISNLILIASRVTLSTDADIKFYCVIAQDARLPEMQVVIIKYVYDVKQGMYQNISRNESFKRTLFSMNLTPQARKERSIEKVFNKLGLEGTTRENILNEFFRSQPAKLGDIGYWRNRFYLKDISMEEFLAAQIANRIKIDFREEKELRNLYDYRSVEGDFVSANAKKGFLIKFKIFDQGVTGGESAFRKKKIEEILRIIQEVVMGYKFKDFDFVEMDDQLVNAKLRVTSMNIYDLNKNKMPLEEIVQSSGAYF